MTSVQEIIAGRYRLESQIASGGMGTVWRAHDELLNRSVAVKLLSDELATDEIAAERFRREARIAASLSHPCMANVFDLVEEDGHPGIVMEYCESETLAVRLARTRALSIDEAIRIGAALLDALDCAHRSGVIHRDVKPGNILLGAGDEVKVADFGIARALGDSSLTRTGTMMGTAAYASPEQVRGEPATPQSDLYAAGLVLYEMLTGARPFGGDSSAAVALARLSVQPARPSSLRPEIPRALDAIALRALAREPSERFSSAEEMRAALMRTQTATQVLPLAGADDPTVAFGAEKPGPRVRRRRTLPRRARALAVVLGPAVALGLVATLVAATESGGGAPVPPAPVTARSSIPPCCTVPDLSGLTADQAEIALAEANLTIGAITTQPSDLPAGTVIAQDPPPAIAAQEESAVDIVIAGAPVARAKHKHVHG